MHTQNPEKALWYCYTTPARREMAAAASLSAIADVLAPRILTARTRSFKVEQVSAPLFPCYGFACAPLSRLQDAIKSTWDIRELVGFGNGPAIVPKTVIDEIRCRLDESGYVRLDGFVPGEEVEIIEPGVYEGLRAIFQREDSSARVVLMLNAINNFSVTVPKIAVRRAS